MIIKMGNDDDEDDMTSLNQSINQSINQFNSNLAAREPDSK